LQELMHQLGCSKISFNCESGVLSSFYFEHGNEDAFRKKCIASDCLQEERFRHMCRYDTDVLQEATTLRAFQDSLSCYSRWCHFKPYQPLSLESPHREMSILNSRPTSGGQLTLLFLRRVPQLFGCNSPRITATAFNAIVCLYFQPNRVLECHVWYSGALRREILCTFSHSVELHSCESIVEMESKFLGWMLNAKPHRLVYHGEHHLPREVRESVDRIAPYHEVNIHKYFLRYMPQLRSHYLTQLGSTLLGCERYGLGTRQQEMLANDGEGRSGARLVDYSVNECHLMLKLWNELHLEQQMKERTNLLGCDIQQLWQLEDFQILSHLCYISGELGAEVPLEFKWPTLQKQLRGPHRNVMECDYKSSLMGHYSTKSRLNHNLILRATALPTPLLSLLLHTLDRNCYLQWWNSLHEILKDETLLQWYPECLLLQECHLLVQHLYNQGQKLIPLRRWVLAIYFECGSWIAVAEDGSVHRRGHNFLCRPKFELQRMMVDSWMQALANTATLPQIPHFTFSECKLHYNGTKVEPIHDLSIFRGGDLHFLWTTGVEIPQPYTTEECEKSCPQHGQGERIDIPRYHSALQSSYNGLKTIALSQRSGSAIISTKVNEVPNKHV